MFHLQFSLEHSKLRCSKNLLEHLNSSKNRQKAHKNVPRCSKSDTISMFQIECSSYIWLEHQGGKVTSSLNKSDNVPRELKSSKLNHFTVRFRIWYCFLINQTFSLKQSFPINQHVSGGTKSFRYKVYLYDKTIWYR